MTRIDDIKKAEEFANDYGVRWFWGRGLTRIKPADIIALVEFYERAIARDKHHASWGNKPIGAECFCAWCEDYRSAIKKVEGEK